MGKKSKSKSKVNVREGSRLRLKAGNFARVERNPKPHETTLDVRRYGMGHKREAMFVTIPFGNIAKVERY